MGFVIVCVFFFLQLGLVGLEDIADLLNEAKSISKTGDDLDLWEVELDRRYGAIIPNDATLAARFEMIFHRSPSEFAPI